MLRIVDRSGNKMFEMWIKCDNEKKRIRKCIDDVGSKFHSKERLSRLLSDGLIECTRVKLTGIDRDRPRMKWTN